MKIAEPPCRDGLTEFNLCKQELVFDMVINGFEDEVLPTEHLTDADLALAHDPRHVENLLALSVPNGFGNQLPAYLRHARASADAMYTAAKAAVTGGTDGHKIAFAPASGFHHAGWDFSHGYCTFNGLMIAAIKLRAQGLIDSVMVIDGDGHIGDGTEDIRARLKLRWVRHISLAHASVGGSGSVAARKIRDAFRANKPSLVMYQAGADAHRDDPYRVGYLSDQQWNRRDLLVFKLCRQHSVPIVWNLAGGYNGTRTAILHDNTFGMALQVFYPRSTRLLFSVSDKTG